MTARNEMQQAAASADERLTPGGASRQGRRPYQEDAYSYSAPPALSRAYGAIFIVADGVGGQQAGSLAAQITTTATQEAYYALRGAGVETLPALKQAIEQANTAVHDEARKQGISRMGATMVAAVIDRGRLYVANVGDARAYLASGGRLQRLTHDHSWVEEQVRAGNISAEDAQRHELRNIVTRVMGNAPAVEVETYAGRPFGRAEILLLCSDGLYDVVPAKRLLALLARSPAPVAAEDLVREAYDTGSQDNITAVVVAGQAEPDPAPAAAGAGSGGADPIAGRRQTRNIALGILGLMALALFLIFVAARDNDGDRAAAALLDAAATATAAVTLPANVLKPAATAAPSATSSLDNVDRALEPDAIPTITPPAGSHLICVESEADILIWEDEQASDQNLCESTDESLSDKVVYLLGEVDSPVPMSGPRGYSSGCYKAQFHRISTLYGDMVGWINAQTPVRKIDSAEECEYE